MINFGYERPRTVSVTVFTLKLTFKISTPLKLKTLQVTLITILILEYSDQDVRVE